MIHSLSPLGRRLVEKMYTGDPYKIDIKLDSDSSNRQAEIANTYLKAIARKLIFEKKKKKYHIVAECPIKFNADPYIVPIMEMPKDLPVDYDPVAAFKERVLLEKKKQKNKKLQSPVAFIPRDPSRTDDLV
jgi:predicted dinucleotide-utilizing enzyme